MLLGKTKLSILKYDTIENIDPSLNDFTLKIKMQNFMAKEEKTFIDVTLEVRSYDTILWITIYKNT